MSLIAHLSDTHENLNTLQAARVVTNHLSDKYGVSCPVLHSGDHEPETYSQENEEIGRFKNQFYSVLGNHDRDDAPEHLSNAKFPSLTETVNGKKVMFIQQHWENSLKGVNVGSENNYGTIDEKLSEIESELKDTDIIVMHEGAHDKMAIKPGNYHKKLGKEASYHV